MCRALRDPLLQGPETFPIPPSQITPGPLFIGVYDMNYFVHTDTSFTIAISAGADTGSGGISR